MSQTTASVSTPATSATSGAGSPAYLLFVLFLVGAVNWADRQVVPILFPGIKRELGLNDTQLGVIGGLAFSLIYALTSFAFGYAADRHKRTRLIALGLVIWSIATAASGLATGFWSLFAARFFTGIGEASLYPCALSLVAERFPAERRGRALGIFASAAAVGGGLGVGIGGKLAQSVGWQQVFFIYGGVGILCLPLLLAVKEEKREGAAQRAEPLGIALKAALTDSRLRWIWATGTLAMASGQGFAAWGPSYFVRSQGLTVAQAGGLFGAAALVGGIVGGFVGGSLSDRRGRLRPGGQLDVPLVAGFAASVLVLVTLEAGPGAVSAGGGLFATLFIYALFPGLLSAMLTLAPPHRHGATGALNTLFLGGVGAASGPFIVGATSNATGNLHNALYIPIVGLVIAGLLALRSGQVIRERAGAG